MTLIIETTPDNQTSYTFTEIVEVEEEHTIKDNSTTQTPIVELPTDQPAPWRRQKKIEESVTQEKIVRKKKIEKHKERSIEIEQEEEEEEEEEEREIAGTKIKPRRPKVREYDMNEEEYDDIEPFDVSSQKQVPLITPSMLSETTPTGVVSQITTGNLLQTKANVDLIPHSALVEEQVEAEEKEIFKDTITNAMFTAKKYIDTREAYEVSEQDIQNIPGIFEGTFKPALSTASPNFTPSEGVSVEQVQLADTSAMITKGDTITFTADFSLLPQEATKISQVEVSQKEDILDEFTLPKKSQATGTFTINESINVEQILHGITETELDVSKFSTVKGKLSIDTNESLIVEQVETETKPGKHLPEAFVPTEIATLRIIPQKSITQSEMVAPEVEGEYVTGRLPPLQKADIELTTGESVIVSQIQPQDKENVFTKAPSPEKLSASENIILMESVSVSLTDSQLPQSDFAENIVKKETANIEILPKETFSTQTTFAVESEGRYDAGDKPDYKTADSTIIYHNTKDISIVTAQDSEKVLDLGEKPTQSLAETSIRPVEGLTVSEVQTTDLPCEFIDYPKFKTDTALPNLETLEATHITETTISEKEGDYVREQLDLKTADSDYITTRIQVEITDHNLMDSEKQLKTFELPESHKSKSVTAHTLPTGVTEQVQPEHSTTDIEESRIISSKADFTHTPHTETVISQAVTDESFETTAFDQPKGKQAELIVSPKESLHVSEILTDDKEKEFVAGESPLEQKAVCDIDAQNVASKTEIQLDYSTQKFNTEKPMSATAEAEQDTLEGLQITQCLTADKEIGEIKRIEIEAKHVAMEFTESMQGPNVTQIILNEKEETYTPVPFPQEGTAVPNITAQEVIVKSEIETVVHADDIKEEELLTGRAKKYSKPLQELIVTETNVVDVEKKLDDDIFPYKKSANVDLVPGQEILVTEVITNQKEEPLVYLKPVESQADLNITETQVAVKEEVTPEISPGDFARSSPEKQLGKLAQDVSHSVIQTQFTLGEKEGEKTVDVIPDQKTVNIEIIETESINVTEVTSDYKEQVLDKIAKPEEFFGEKSISSHVVASKTEVQVEYTVDNLNQLEVTPKQATTESSVLKSLVTGEIIVQEKESSFTESKPDFKSATEDYALGESVTVSSITAGDKEQNFSEIVPKLETADSILSTRNEIQIGETIPTDSLGNYDKLSPTTFTAIPTQSELQSVINLEAVLGESESAFQKDLKPDEKTAEVEYEESEAAVTSETLAADKEQLYEQPKSIISSQATFSFDVQPVAETNIVVAENITKDVVADTPVTAQANIDQTTLEGIIFSQSIIQDKEASFEKVPFDAKIATISFREDSSVMTTQTETAENEDVLKSSEKPEGKYAQAGVDTLESVIKSEVDVSESLKNLEILQTEPVSALSEVSALGTAVSSETVPSESDLPLEIPKVDVKNVLVSINEGQSVIVGTVMINENEEDLIKLTTETRTAESVLTDLQSVAVVSQAQLDSSVGEFTTEIKETTSAITETVPFNIAMQSEQITVDKERLRDEELQPVSVIASVNVESVEGVSISEATSGFKEETFVPLMLPTEKIAFHNIDVTHKVAETITTDVTADVKHIEGREPETQRAQEAEESLSSLIISENIAEEKEVVFHGKFVPATSTVNVLLEEGKKVVSVTDTTIQDKEGLVKEFDSPISQQASLSYDAKLVPQQTEIETSNAPGELFHETPQKSIAAVKHTTYEELVQTVPIVQESGESLEDKITHTTKKAEITIEEKQIISTSEIVPAEKERLLECQYEPESTSASVDIISNFSMQTSEVLTSSSLGDIEIKKPKEVLAVSGQNTIEGLTQSIIVSMDTFGQFEDTFKPTTKTAETKIDSLSEITTSEMFIAHQSGFLDKFETKPETAISEYNATKKSLQAIEVLPSENVSDFKTELKETVTGHVTQDILESITLSENIVHESETGFEKQPLFDTKHATTTVDEKSSVNITDVYVAENENDLGEFIKEEKFGTTTITTNLKATSQTEVIPHDNVGKISIEKPSEEKAEIAEDILQGLIISEKTVQETEVSFSRVPVECKTGNLLIIPETHIAITEITATDKETEFVKTLQSVTSKADQLIASQEVPVVEQTTIHEGLSKFFTEIPSHEKALEEHIPLRMLNITEINSSEKEGDLKNLQHPTTQMASLDLEKPRKTASKIQIVTEEKEISFKDTIKVQASTASQNIMTQEAPVVEEVKVQEDIIKFRTDGVNHEIATAEHIPYTTANVMETTSIDKEESFSQGKHPLAYQAELEIEKARKTASKTMVLTQEKEIELVEALELKTSKADRSINLKKVPLVEEVMIEDNIENLKTKVPDEAAASQDHVPHSTISITEITSIEIEGDYKPEDRPKTKLADLELEETRTAASTAQVVVQEKETIFEDTATFKTSQANKIITYQEVPVIEEVRTQQDISTLTTLTPETEQAEQLHIPYSTVTITEITSTEKEKYFKSDEKQTTQTAEIEFEETRKIPSKTQIIAQEKESSFDQLETKTTNADKTVIPQEAPQIQETRLEENLQELTSTAPDQGEAQQEHITHKSVSITVITSTEKEGIYKSGDKPITQLVDVELEELQKSASITEILIQEKEKMFEKIEIQTSKADQRVSLQEAPIVQETQSEEDVGKFISEIPLKEKAQKDHIPHKTVGVTEIISTEKESVLEAKDKPAMQSAELDLEKLRKTAATAEILIQEKEKSFENIQIKTSKADQLLAPQEEPIVIQETSTEENLGKLVSEVPSKEKAQEEHVPHKTVSITEVRSTEKEGTYKQEDLPIRQLAELELEGFRETASTAEVVFQEKEEIFKSSETKTSKADQSVSPQEAPVVQETMIEEIIEKLRSEAPTTQTAELDLEKGRKLSQKTLVKPFESFEELPENTQQAKKASKTTIPLESIVESIIQVQGNTESINPEKQEYQTASLNILLKESLTVTEVTSQGQVGKDISEALAKESTAQPEVVHRPVSLKEETLTLLSSDDFKAETPRLSKAQTDLTETHGLIISEIKSTGDLETIEHTIATPKTVKVTMEDRSSSLQISEVQLEEKEGELITKD